MALVPQSAEEKAKKERKARVVLAQTTKKVEKEESPKKTSVNRRTFSMLDILAGIHKVDLMLIMWTWIVTGRSCLT